jgi:hypothetical protein
LSNPHGLLGLIINTFASQASRVEWVDPVGSDRAGTQLALYRSGLANFALEVG